MALQQQAAKEGPTYGPRSPNPPTLLSLLRKSLLGMRPTTL